MEISNQIGFEVNDDTLFFDGVGISGYDATMLIRFIVERYNVDFSGFIHSDYYIEDGENFVSIFFNHLFGRRKFPNKQFSGDHLFNVVNKGYWFDPPNGESF